MVLIRKAALGLLLLLVAGAAAAEKTYVLKFATIAPDGSSWMNILHAWAKNVEARSNGRLKLQIFPGGVAGDESDVLAKVRFGELQGGAITGHGIGMIYPPARVLEMPFLFHNYDEIDYVRKRLFSELERGFSDHGFTLIGWADVGFVRFFSQEPISSMDDLRKRRVWLWEGDPLVQAFFSAADVAPIPLSITEVFTSLSTGLIDTVYAPPLGAIVMQWFIKTRYMTEAPMGDGIGALVVGNRFFRRLPKDLRDLLLSSGQETGERAIRATRLDNEKALTTLRNKGIHFVPWKPSNDAQVSRFRDQAARRLARNGYIPAELYRRVEAMLARYRQGH
jgi:TRAP-type transport system periplasmic protein